MEEGARLGRRRFLALAAAPLLLPAAASATPRLPAPRALALENLHTGERLKAVYWSNGHYDRAALHEINWILRDFRTDEVVPINRNLLDALAELRRRLRTTAPVHVVSGYRSPRTNAMLAAASDGVARNSLHTAGMAIDIRVPGRSLRHVHRAAVALQAGGVGYYPRSGFVHLDVGRVRYW
jgi:uncharacterized protein YcbK (DUF882 family)